MLRHLSITVSGRVQGVYYRASTKEQADRLNIKGFVRNEKNGDVYIEAVGMEENLKDFIAWCKRGSARAKVDHVEWKELSLKNFSDFTIQR
ncbi:MAG: acylphosphatase [Bacteroidetes bacterium]|nr:acylphosphatase [Bacteroidota bacterium]MBS1541005.1 acylphosphatase [Bacteroidota bacterium]